MAAPFVWRFVWLGSFNPVRKRNWVCWPVAEPVVPSKPSPCCVCVTGRRVTAQRAGALGHQWPLWLGPLQQVDLLEELMASPVPVAPATRRLLQRLQADPGGLGHVWSTAELARRCGSGPPPLQRSLMPFAAVDTRPGPVA